mgnify:FL=1
MVRASVVVGMLDTVRGMAICGSLDDALAMILALEEESNKAAQILLNGDAETSGAKPHLLLERSKNRFRDPSSGGWMDCLVNVRVVGQIRCENLLSIHARIQS